VVGFAAVAGGTHVFRWTQATGMQDLGTLSGLKSATATSVSSDGNIIVGYADPTTAQNGATGWTLSSNSRPFVWTQAAGIQDLNTLLGSAGIDMTGVTLMTAFVSHDGPFIMGGGTFSDTPGGSISFYLARYCNGPDSGACARLAFPGTHDFNANGMSDIAWRDTSGNTAIWLMSGTTVANLNSSFIADVAGQWTIVGQRDFNGDGYADVLWHDTSGNVAIWEMNGTKVLNANSSYVANVPTPQWSILGTGDFNADGMGDILWQDMSGNVAIWEMNGTTVLNANSSFVAKVPSQWSIKGTGDFNGDGKADILWQDTSHNVAIWEMNGTAMLNQNSSFVANVPSQWSIKGTGDFNGDGKTDILWQDISGNVAIWEMNGTTVLNPNSSFVGNVASQWSILLTGDFNGDGKSDILFQDSSGNVAIWEMNGTAVLNASTSFVAKVPGQWTLQHLSAD
jgi:VCBS repeat protein